MKRVLLAFAFLLMSFSTKAQTASIQCTKPVFSNVVMTPDATGQNATVTWTTNVVSNSQVVYGSPNPGTALPLADQKGVTSHKATITGLIPGGTSYGWGLASEAISATGLPCGSGYTTAYNGAGGTTFVTTKPPAGTFNYAIYATPSPHYVTQGYGVYVGMRLQTLVGTSTGYYLRLALTGLPPFSSVLWTNDETAANGGLGDYDADVVATTKTPGDTLSKVYSIDSKEMYITTNVGGVTPVGKYTVTMIGSCQMGASCGYPTVTATFPLNVISSTTPFSGVAFPYGTPKSYPPIPNLAIYKASANTYGQQNCAQDGDKTPRGIRPNDNSNLTPVGFSTTYQTWFYDGVNVYFNVENLLQNGLNWVQCRINVQQVYRNNYAIPKTIQEFMTFSTGAYRDYLATGDPLDIQMINKFNTSDTMDIYHGGAIDVSYLQREAAYYTRNLIHAITLKQTQNIGTLSPIYLEKYGMEHVLGHLDQICLSQNAQYWENFMIGLEVDTLIQHYDLIDKDPRIPPAIKCTTDYLFKNQWQAIDPGVLPYDKWQWLANGKQQNTGSENGGSCMNVLSQFITPMYGWMFMMTGSTTYQEEGDAIFTYAAALTGGGKGEACLAGQGPAANLTWPGYSDGKIYSEQYDLGPLYVQWRTAPSENRK